MIATRCPVYEVRWLSGRKRRTRNAVCQQWYLGFESLTHLHRHITFLCTGTPASSVPVTTLTRTGTVLSPPQFHRTSVTRATPDCQ